MIKYIIYIKNIVKIMKEKNGFHFNRNFKKRKYKCNIIKRNIFLLFYNNKINNIVMHILLIFCSFITVSNKSLYNFRNLKSDSEITLTIKGSGNQLILNSDFISQNSFDSTSCEILINNIPQEFQNSFEYYLPDEDENIINIKWNIPITNCDYMFYQMSNIIKIDISKFDSSEVVSMNQMFAECSSLTSLNLENLDTSKVTEMVKTFSRCILLTSIDLSSFSTSSVNNMGYMFDYCDSLESLNLNNLDTSHVVNMYNIFI